MAIICKSTVIYKLLDLPIHKLEYAVRTNLIEGMFLTLPHYNVPLTLGTFDLFYIILTELLSGDSNIEYEFQSEEAYNNVRNLQKHCS